jgi:EAL domain-containing protein (putative c-di-GMP-specific phosphodiesterase class I)
MIVLAAIQLGHSLGARVVAEGVERRDVDTPLREFGCDYAQGYFYGRPEPAEISAALFEDANREAA